MNETFDFLTLALLPGIGPRQVRELASRAPLRDILCRPGDHADLIPEPARARLAGDEARREAEAELSGARALGARILGRDEPDYPPLLRETFDPPPVLYVRGHLVRGEGQTCVGMVGSRSASSPGVALARAMARDLAGAGAAIVSGLARGIDSAAHRGALDAKGRTLAILGSALDRLYPAENASLAAAIEARGAVVSEFRLGTPPAPGNFPRRNRVIAGWGRALVVVEAGARSGTLWTVRAALDEGRDVMAVPGHPSHPGGEGVNRLIRDGAVLVRDAADVAQELGLALPRADPEVAAGDLLGLLRRDVPQSLEQLQQRSGKPIPELLARLSELEIGACVRRLPGAVYVRT